MQRTRHTNLPCSGPRTTPAETVSPKNYPRVSCGRGGRSISPVNQSAPEPPEPPQTVRSCVGSLQQPLRRSLPVLGVGSCEQLITGVRGGGIVCPGKRQTWPFGMVNNVHFWRIRDFRVRSCCCAVYRPGSSRCTGGTILSDLQRFFLGFCRSVPVGRCRSGPERRVL